MSTSRRTFVLATGMVLALTSLSACTKTDDAPDHHRGLRAGDRYVALGDSYTAAPRTGPSDVEDGCLRTTVNYPHLVAQKLDLDLTDVSCGGATTQQVTEQQLLGPYTAQPQANALSSDTNLVTISLGANDFNTFLGLVAFCPAVRVQDPTGAPCTKLTQAAGKDTLDQRQVRIEKRIITVVRLVEQRSPNARIVIVGYPQFFPTTGPCDQLPLADGDYALARHVNELLIEAQKGAAAKTKVDYLDVYAATKGHNMCASDPWMAGATPTRTDTTVYHPYPEEQRVVADLLVDLLRPKKG